VPFTPDPAVAGPCTGGQYVAHEPLHFEVVEVSGANQYKVNPLELVSSVALPTFLLDRVVEVEPAAGADAVGELPEPPEPPEPPVVDVELPHAATTSVAAIAPTGTSHLFRMTCLRSDEIDLLLTST
jgi:hypothetical protein